MTLPPDFATVAILSRPILIGIRHFRAILQNSYQVPPQPHPTTAKLGTHL